eukprot:313283_1
MHAQRCFMNSTIPQQSTTNKVLLMGKAKAGKTSMKSIIFANYLAKDTSRLGPTIKIAHSTLRFLGDLQLDLWDCGGQDKFLQSYFESQRDVVFRNVAVLIYVFDIESLEKQANLNSGMGMANVGMANDFYEFNTALGAIRQQSPKAKIFCLIHKMDTILLEYKQEIFTKHCRQLQKEAKTFELNITCFATSIWDETLFKAWSQIVCSLLMDETVVKHQLDILCQKCQTDEIVLFEAATLLFITHSTKKGKILKDVYRFERIANIVKQFKLRCNKAKYLFQSMTVSNNKFTAFIGPFTKTTYVLAVISDPKIEIDAVIMNLNSSKHKFNQLLALHVGGHNKHH